MPEILKGVATIVLLVALVACSGGGLVPNLEAGEETVTPVEVTITVEHPYPIWIRPVPQHPGIPEVTVTCLTGCEGQQTFATDQDGKVTFLGQPPMIVRAEKVGHIATEQSVSSGSMILLGHEWPPEVAASFRRLKLPSNLLLNWNEDEVLGGDWGGVINCNGRPNHNGLIIVIAKKDRRRMLSALEHELFHAHQDEAMGGALCSPPEPDSEDKGFYERWAETGGGKEWIAATTADRDAGRMVGWLDGVGSNFWDTPAESVADYYSYWIRSKWPDPADYTDRGVGVEDLCFLGDSERCRYMEKRFGPRPPSYP